MKLISSIFITLFFVELRSSGADYIDDHLAALEELKSIEIKLASKAFPSRDFEKYFGSGVGTRKVTQAAKDEIFLFFKKYTTYSNFEMKVGSYLLYIEQFEPEFKKSISRFIARIVKRDHAFANIIIKYPETDKNGELIWNSKKVSDYFNHTKKK